MRRISCFFLSIVMVLSVFASMPITVSAKSSGACGENVKWTFDDGVLTISGTGETDYYDPEIWYPPWVDFNYEIKEIVIEPGVENISGFFGCVNLTSVSIPDTVTRIEWAAFSNCNKLESITLPESLQLISLYSFSHCSSLTSIIIPDSVETIGDCAFYECTSLKSVTIGGNVNSIGDSAFARCGKLASINVSDNNSKYCSINGVLFNKNKTVLMQYPANKTLTSYVVPDSVKTIDDYAFLNSTKLTSITIPDSVKNIGYQTFFNTGHYNDNNNWENGVLYINNHLIAANSCKQDGNYYEYTGNVSGSYKIKKGTKTIAEDAFYNCQELISIEIPDSIICIGDTAFCNCTKIKTIVIPDSVTSLGSCVFSDCTSLESVTIGNGIKNIEWKTFDSCINLNSVAIPSGVTTIASEAFYNCPNLKSVTIPKSVKSIGSEAFGYYIDKETYAMKKINGFTIYSLTDSAAEKYAKENSFKFIEIKNPTQPTLKKVSNVDGYVKVTWGAVDGADSYSVYRKVSTGSYEYIGSTTNTSYIDKKAPAGKTCRYIVKAKNEAGYSEASTSLAIKHIDEPTLKTIANTSTGVKITWSKVTGAKKYSIYRKVSGGEYKYLGATSNTYYTDKTASSGKKYYYAIRAKDGDSISSQSSARSKLYLDNPTLSTPSSTTKGVGLRWSKVAGAQGYVVYRKTGSSGTYTKITTEKGVSNLTYRDTTAKKGKKYYYKVKAYYSKTYSAFSNTKSVTDKY